MGIRVTGLAVLTVAVIAAASQGSAHAQQAPPTVSIVDVESPRIFENSCSSPPSESRHPGAVRFARTGPTAEPLAIAFRVTGAAGPTEGSATFAAGADSTVAEVVAVGPAGPFTVEVVDGSDYDLGEPSSVEDDVLVATPVCASSTTITELPRTGGGVDHRLLSGALGLLLAGGALLGRSRSARHAG